ncbi:hypothetical protein COV04_03830 [Candidatus Uhrbacteria bacterium CG10_big_fil_rev_8_21_14_0_10_48_11]|uniref:Uncharacterized protein n=1 Tax=Candidatus Uhrbacteria bacterium CG10_big_fil_rev_8_21_14_0_10_48_11 TaxID=1975037 RepID=A0A2M8LE18_9BACT|nr:MAG: hypothetical protein COV04_03830 [Candidatus Uhrbacteria bacterium CG10_big_fil_rev_8_21_14_0_10_48_11]
MLVPPLVLLEKSSKKVAQEKINGQRAEDCRPTPIAGRTVVQDEVKRGTYGVEENGHRYPMKDGVGMCTVTS